MTKGKGIPHLSVAAPCYNEVEGIEAVLEDWNKVLDGVDFSSEIVLCNDGSQDGTGPLLETLKKQFPRLVVVSFDENGGYGRALSAAVARTTGEYVVTIDSDGQFDLQDGVDLLAVLEQGHDDGVMGRRRKKRDSWFRVVADRCLNLFVRNLFGLSLRDTNCALKVVRGDILRGLTIEGNGYPVPTEICVRLDHLGCRLVEQDVAHLPREVGVSKLHTIPAVWSMMCFLAQLRFKLWADKKGAKVQP